MTSLVNSVVSLPLKSLQVLAKSAKVHQPLAVNLSFRSASSNAATRFQKTTVDSTGDWAMAPVRFAPLVVLTMSCTYAFNKGVRKETLLARIGISESF